MKRYMSLILALLMAFGLFGCAQGTQTPSAEATAAPTAAVTQAPANESTAAAQEETPETLEDGPLTPYAETLTVRYVIQGSDGIQFDDENTAEDNAWTRAYKEYLNIDMELLWAVPNDQSRSKWELAMASNDLPDICALSSVDYKVFRQLDMVADLTDAFDKYASEALKKAYANDPQALTNALDPDNGKLYVLPGGDSSIQEVPMLFYRNDWLDNLGMEEPKSMDDVLKIAEAFAKEDPDKNGKDDTVGLSLSKDLFTSWGWTMSPIEGFFNGFHSDPVQWTVTEDGNLGFGGIQPEAKIALEALQKLYASGGLDPEFSVIDSQKIVENTTVGKIGLFYGVWWTPEYPLCFNVENQPEADWRVMMLPSVDNDVAKGTRLTHGSSGPGGKAILSSHSNPEVIIKMLNFLLYVSSVGGELYKATEKVEYANPLKFDFPNEYLGIYREVSRAYETGDDTDMSGKAQYYYGVVKDYFENGGSDPWAQCAIYTNNNMGIYQAGSSKGPFQIVEEIIENEAYHENEYKGPRADAEVKLGANLRTLQKEIYTRIILGESIDLFDSFIVEWKANGGDEWTKEVNDWTMNNK